MTSTYDPFASAGSAVAKGTLKTLGGMVYQWDGSRWFNTGVPDATTTNQPHSVAEDIAIASAPRFSNSNSTSTNFSSSTSQNNTPFAIQTNGGVYVYDPTDKSMSLIPGSNQMSPAEQAQYATQWNVAQLNAATSAQNTQTTEQGANARNAASLAGTASEGALNRQETAAEADANRAFTGQQTRDQQAFTSGESLLSRAQQAGEFAATYALQKQQAQQALIAQQLQAAKTYSDLSAAPDLTGYQRFNQAGGGVLGNSLAAGATSLTPQGQLGAARALEAARTPIATIPDYVNPYAGIDVTKNPYLAQQSAAPLPTASAGVGGVISPAERSAGAANMAALQQMANNANSAPNASGAVQASGPVAMSAPGTNADTQNAAMQSAGVPSWVSGFAFGTGHEPIRREPVTAMPAGASIDQVTDRFANGTSHGPAGTFYGRTRYALGTLGRPVQKLGALHIDPNGGGYPPGYAEGTQDRYAHGSFITGDSTDPTDPAAGGAHPEEIDLTKDAHDQPEAAVTPLTPPGVGPTEPDGDEGGEDPERLAALLRAIADFLDKDDEDEQEGAPLGAMGKRFALGTMARYAGGTDDTGLLDPNTTSPLDQQTVDEVMQTRQQTPFSVNPYALDYSQQSPTSRAIAGSSFQTATGVPSTELAFEANKYAPGGLARGSTYSRELDLGI